MLFIKAFTSYPFFYTSLCFFQRRRSAPHIRRCVFSRRRRGLTECVTAGAVGARAHLRSAYTWMADDVDAQSDDDGGRWVRQPPKVGKWRTSGTQRLVSRRIPARYAALCVPGYGRVPSLCDERVQTEG